MLKLRQLLAAIIIATLATICALAQSSLTQIRDLITNSDGTPFNGQVVITWNGYSVPSGTPVSQLSASARIYNGALSVLLVPTTNATAGTYYQVVYTSSDGTVTWTETWQVPPSTTALTLAQVRQSTTQGTGSVSSPSTTQYATLPIAISQVTNLSSTLSGLTSSVAALNTQVAALPSSATMTALQSTVSTLSTTVSGLTTTVNGITSTVTGLSNSVATNTTSIANLTSSLGTVTTNVSTLTTSLNSLTNTVNGLVSTVNALSSVTSTAVYVDAQTPSGTINGTNTTFTLPSTPSPVGSLALYRNGLLQMVGVDYSLSGAVITFLSGSTPQSGDVLQAYYRVPGTGTSNTLVDSEVPTGAVNGTNLSFTLANAPNPAASLKLYKNGLLMAQGGDYTLSGAAIAFIQASAPQTGDSLLASYRH